MSGLKKQQPKLNSVKKCRACRKSFRPTKANQIYCQTDCRKTYDQASKVKALEASRLERATGSAFFYYLASECQRGGTVEVLHGHTLESLMELYEGVYKYALRANGWGSTERLYSISHVMPVNGNTQYIGLLHPANVFVCPTLLNLQHGTKHFGYGKCIRRDQISGKWAVGKDDSLKKVIGQIVLYLGKPLVTEFAKKARIQPSERLKLVIHLGLFLDELEITQDELEACSTVALKKLKAELEGKQGYAFTSYPFSPEMVLLHESQRMAKHRPDEFEEFIGVIESITEHQTNAEWFGVPIPESELAKAMSYAWSVLLGKQADGLHLHSLVKNYLPSTREYNNQLSLKA